MSKVWDYTTNQWVKVGKSGAPGKSVLNGSGPPSAGVGAEGDFYVDKTNFAFYGPKTSGVWGSPATMLGAPASTVGNLLSANVASGTDTLGDTTGFVPVNVALSSTTDWAAQGSRSLKLIANLSVTSCYAVWGGTYSQGQIPVVPGQVYTATATIRTPDTAPIQRFVVRWFGADGTTYIGSDTEPMCPAPSATALAKSYTVTAPAGAYFASLYFYSNSAWVVGNSLLIDAIGFWAGAGGKWAMPGTPIANLGTKVSHPNVDDVLVQRWDSSKATPGWQTIHYDSGWRNIASWDAAGTVTGAAFVGNWAPRTGVAGFYVIRRINGAVYFNFNNVQATGTPSTGTGIWGAMPTGFAPYGTAIPSVSASASTVVLKVITGGICRSDNQTINAGNVIYFCSAAMSTNDAIPTALPGTLVSAAPA